MAIGDRIRFFRKWAELTQRELGLMLGFSERTADVRISQYESNLKTPRPEMLAEIAKALNVNVAALVAPDISSSDRIIQTLFMLEDELGFFIDKENGYYCLGLNCNHPRYQEMLEFFSMWHDAYQQYKKCDGNAIEYNKWRYRFPHYIPESNDVIFHNYIKRKEEIATWKLWCRCVNKPSEGIFNEGSLYMGKMITESNPQTFQGELIDEGFFILDAVNETFHYSMRDFSTYFKVE